MGWRSTRIIVVFVLAFGACSGDSDSGESDTTVPASTTTAASTAPATEPPATEPETTVTEPPETTTTEPPDAARPVTMLNRDDFGAPHALNGPIVQHDGTFHIFYIAGEANFGDVRIARATSPDAVRWTMVDDRLFGPDDLPYGSSYDVHADVIVQFADAILPSSAAVTANGEWVIYFHTQDSVYGTRDSVIGMATAPAPEGPWTIRAEPTLEPGEDGAWDSHGVANPNVIADDAGFLMWYDGHAGDQDTTRDRAIGLATSNDGYTWSRVGSEPVLTAGEPGDWDELRVLDPNVVVSDDGYAMSYSTMKSAGSRFNNGYGLAYSEDGMTWEKDGDAYLWLIQDGEFLMPGLIGSFSSTMIDGPKGHQMLFDLIFAGYGETYAVAPPT